MSRKSQIFVLLLSLLLGRADLGVAAPGALDPTFGVGGFAISPLRGQSEVGTVIVVQADGKIVVAGHADVVEGEFQVSGRLFLERRFPDGRIDPTFGDAGRVTSPGGPDWYGDAEAAYLAVQGDGCLLLGGSGSGKAGFTMLRYRPDGTIDETFGQGGVVRTPLGDTTFEASSIVAQPDGRVVLAGALNHGMAVVRYAANGELDATFGQGGVATVPVDADFGGGFGNFARFGRVALQADGQLVVVAATRSSPAPYGFSVSRLTAAGTVDTDFGKNGIATIPVSNDFEKSWALALQPDGKILIGGGLGRISRFGAVVYRLLPGGIVDADFGNAGQTLLGAGNLESRVAAMALTADGEIDVAGYTTFPGTATMEPQRDMLRARLGADGQLDQQADLQPFLITTDIQGDDEALSLAVLADGGMVVAGRSDGRVAVARYTEAGPLDQVFGVNGVVENSFRTTARTDLATSMVLQPDGKLAVAGTSADGTNIDFVLARYDETGHLDPGFGDGGKVFTDFHGAEEAHPKVVRQPDGKLVLAGISGLQSSNANTLALVRYLPNGELDPAFGTGGKVEVPVSRAGRFPSVVIQKDGRLVVLFTIVEAGHYRAVLYRFTASGALDVTFGSGGQQKLWPQDALESLGGDLIAQPDGTMLVLALTYRQGSSTVVLRLRPDGQRDVTFGNAGQATLSTGWFSPNCLARQADGKIIVAGETSNEHGVARPTVLRWLPDGVPDASFGVGGVNVSTRSAGYTFVNSVAVQADGKIVLAGAQEQAPMLVRFLPSGRVDRAFGEEGISTMRMGRGAFDSTASLAALGIQPDGKIVAAGQVKTATDMRFALFRFESDTPQARVIISGPGSGAAISRAAILLRGEASGEQDISRIEVRLNGGAPVPAVVQGRAARAGFRAQWSLPVPLSSGVNRVEVSVMGQDGERLATATRAYLRISGLLTKAGTYRGTLAATVRPDVPVPSVGTVFVKAQPSGAFTAVVKIGDAPNANYTFRLRGVFLADGTARFGPDGRALALLTPKAAAVPGFSHESFGFLSFHRDPAGGAGIAGRLTDATGLIERAVIVPDAN